MKKFTLSATGFYTLAEGERLTARDMYDQYRIYVIWPVDGKWRLRHNWLKGWESISEGDFDNADEAFSYAYEHFLKNHL